MSPSIIVQPLIKVLSLEAIAQVHYSSLQILSEIGIRIDSENALKRLKNSTGVTFIDDQHIVFHPEIVECAIQQAPSVIDIYNRKRELSFRLGEDQTRFGIGVTNLFYEIPETREIFPFTRENMRSAVGMGNKLSSYDVISTR
jgi:trimethylamine:corrinoid methyltransferase-like protein